MFFLAPLVVVFIGAWGLYNTDEVWSKAEYDMYLKPPQTQARSSLDATETRLRRAVAEGRMSDGEAQQAYQRAQQLAGSGL